MAVDFHALREQVDKDNQLSTDYFGETVQFLPAGGAPRSVTGHVHLEQEAKIEPANQETMETIVFTCLRNAADADLGGIDRIKVGDGLIRDSERDPVSLRYVFAGEIRNTQRHKWKLVFIRHIQTQQGRQ